MQIEISPQPQNGCPQNGHSNNAQGRLFSNLEMDGCRDGDFPAARQGAARVEMTLFKDEVLGGTNKDISTNQDINKRFNYEWNKYARLNQKTRAVGLEGVKLARKALEIERSEHYKLAA